MEGPFYLQIQALRSEGDIKKRDSSGKHLSSPRFDAILLLGCRLQKAWRPSGSPLPVFSPTHIQSIPIPLARQWVAHGTAASGLLLQLVASHSSHPPRRGLRRGLQSLWGSTHLSKARSLFLPPPGKTWGCPLSCTASSRAQELQSHHCCGSSSIIPSMSPARRAALPPARATCPHQPRSRCCPEAVCRQEKAALAALPFKPRSNASSRSSSLPHPAALPAWQGPKK